MNWQEYVAHLSWESWLGRDVNGWSCLTDIEGMRLMRHIPVGDRVGQLQYIDMDYNIITVPINNHAAIILRTRSSMDRATTDFPSPNDS